MTTSEVTANERRSGTQDMVEKLLVERNEMLAKFCETAGLTPFNEAEPSTKVLQEFCEVLVDYFAFGHFEIYERIVDGRERRQNVVDTAREVYARIIETSEAAVNFNDKYDATDHVLDTHELDKDLSHLGEELAIRVEMEDRIIAALTEGK